MKHLIRVPVGRLTGVYGAHQKVYEVAGETKRPLWRKYPDHILILADEPSLEFESKPYDPNPVAGMTVMMSLLFDVSICQGPKGNNRRVDPVLSAWVDSKSNGVDGASWSQLGSEIGKKWLKSRQEKNGFKLIESDLQIDRSEYETLEFIRKERPIRIGVIDFLGMVEITDAEKFKLAMTNGIGHSKAWGCGLVLCNRVN